MDTLGSRIRDLRIKHNLSMGALAKKIELPNKTEFEGVTRQLTSGTISNIENNKHSPNADIVVAIAKYFKVSTDYLLLGKETEFDINGTFKLPVMIKPTTDSEQLTIDDVVILKSLIDFIGEKKKSNG